MRLAIRSRFPVGDSTKRTGDGDTVMMNERFIHTDDESSGTWTVVGLVLGAIVVAVSLYFGGVFTETGATSYMHADITVSQPASTAK
jgi:hypothetical protein